MTTSPKRIEEYLKLYREDKSYREVGEVFGLHGSTVYVALKNAGKLESRSASPKTSPDRIEEYLKLYGEGKTYEQVGKVFGLDGNTIRMALQRVGKLESRRTGRPKTSEERIEEYIDLYRTGKTHKQIGEIFWLTEGAISSALKKSGKLEPRSKAIQNSSLERIEEYLKLYREGKSYRKIGKVFNLTTTTIYGILKRAGRLESRRIKRQKT